MYHSRLLVSPGVKRPAQNPLRGLGAGLTVPKDIPQVLKPPSPRQEGLPSGRASLLSAQAMALPWHCLALPSWHCHHDIAMALPWHCHGNAMALPRPDAFRPLGTHLGRISALIMTRKGPMGITLTAAAAAAGGGTLLVNSFVKVKACSGT